MSTIPTYQEWYDSDFDYKCDVYVSCTDGTEQYINDVNIYYGLSTKTLMLRKRGYLVEDYFFVKEVLRVDNVRQTV